MASGILTVFLAALQASIAVLLTIFYGAIAGNFNLISEGSAKDISKTCVRLFLPALLIHNVGSQLSLDSGAKYIPILIFAIVYNTISMAFGLLCTRIFKFPAWVTPAIAFNNTTSLPLLLVQSLSSTGVLSALDGSDDVVDRAKSYFLVNAIVSNSLTFALGPRLLNGQEEDAPDNDKGDEDESSDVSDEENGVPVIEATEDVEGGRIKPTQQHPAAASSDHDDNDDENNNNDEQVTEETSLLPDPITRKGKKVGRKAYKRGARQFSKLPPWAQSALDFAYQFANAPVIGAALGCLIGLTPALHRLFFSAPDDGGYFKAWLTSSLKNVGDLFAALQVVVVGVKLCASLRKQKAGQESGDVPWLPFAIITFVRYVLWPLISIPLVWALATRTSVLDEDPILWFAMMLMPAGPPALKLTALADVNGSDEREKMSIAKFLTLSYVISPLICFSVVGSLKASEAAVGR
ncbi:putative auxin efflux carrier superfamily [Diplodia seriata]|uniref:Putative auxin efflux carrier superfamily n=1 Tax=Diplodia seriata TaxID=420778 RepID=A0A0G2G5L0_9PEZI|nr:putative auxin efflux carrier superfamily [Diplodia seriata]